MATVTRRGTAYKITVSCGYDINGKQLRKHLTWEPSPGMTERQIEKLDRQKVLFEEKCRSGQVLDDNIRFVDFADKWFKDYAEKQLRPRTINRYRSLMSRINAAIGHPAGKAAPHHLMAFYDNLAEQGVREDIKYKAKTDLQKLMKDKKITREQLSRETGISKGTITNAYNGRNVSMSTVGRMAKYLDMEPTALFEEQEGKKTLDPRTILHHHRVISSILSTAVHWQVLNANPCDRVKPPKVGQKEARYLDEEEAGRLLEALEGEPTQYRVIVLLLLHMGLRRGELCGLEWEDIDLQREIVTVRRSSLYLPEKGIFDDETKNDSSIRNISIAGPGAELLREYRAWQNEERLKIGDQWQDHDRLFTQWNGKPIHPDTITGWFHKFVENKGLPPISIHSLRHTNATLQIAAGIPIPTVADRLGHARPYITMTTYAHAIRSANEAAAEALGKMLKHTNGKKGF